MTAHESSKVCKSEFLVSSGNRHFAIAIESGKGRNGRLYTIAIREKVQQDTLALMVWVYRDGKLEPTEFVPYEDWVVPLLYDESESAMWRRMERDCISCSDVDPPTPEQIDVLYSSIMDRMQEIAHPNP